MRRDKPVSIEVELYDPVRNQAHEEAAKEQLDGFCSRYLPGLLRVPGYITNVSSPQQVDGSDCGVFIVAFAAYVVTQRTIVTIDPTLWRFIIRIMTDLTDPLLPSSELLGAKEHGAYSKLSLLALPRVPIKPSVLATATTANILEFDEYTARVLALQCRVRAETTAGAKSRLPTWKSVHQQLLQTGAVLEKMADIATKNLDASQAYVRQKEREGRSYQALEVAHQ
ncbi:ulp1 protease family protein [Colletotrichum tofieldiae]|nr:ulp1 protease family protein [Colletotrichum tofieldiae]